LILPSIASSKEAYTLAHITIAGIHFLGGSDCLYLPNGAVWFQLQDITFEGCTHAGLHTRGFNQEIVLHNVNFFGGQFGFYLPNDEGTGGHQAFLDKSTFDRVYASGQSDNGFVLRPTLSTTVSFIDCTVNYSKHSGMVLDGGLNGWTFINLNTEMNGRLDSEVYTPPTKASGMAGSREIAVTSTKGLSPGDVVTVQNAGDGSRDLSSRIRAVLPSGLLLDQSLATTVRGVELTKYRYSDIEIGAEVAHSGNFVFVNCMLSDSPPKSGLRYGLDLSGVRNAGVWFIGGATARPIYDPYHMLREVDGTHLSIRDGDVATTASGAVRTFFSNTPTMTLVSQQCRDIKIDAPNVQMSASIAPLAPPNLEGGLFLSAFMSSDSNAVVRLCNIDVASRSHAASRIGIAVLGAR
jgi:hypothetical protein